MIQQSGIQCRPPIRIWRPISCKVGLFGLTLAFAFVPYATAADKGSTATPNIETLIGVEVTGTAYPAGWKQLASDGFGSSPYVLTTLRSGRLYGLLLERKLNDPKRGERMRVIVTDAIRVDNPTSNHKFSRLCYWPADEAKKTESNIFANVGFAKFCDMKTTLIRRAWKVNLQTGKFDPIPNTKGLVCEYGFVSLGEPDFREGCPTYNWR